MIKITPDDLLQEPETKRPEPLGRLATIFDVIVTYSINKFDQGEMVVYNKSRYQIDNVDSNTVMPNDYVRVHCHEIKEFDKYYKPTGTLLYM